VSAEMIDLASAQMEFHEVAGLFPMMSEEERRELAEDIRENGLREPIWTYQGKIVDGRNRYLACLSIGVSPRFREWDGQGSLTALVVSLNMKRRHLTPGQKAAVGVDALPFFEAEAMERRLATLKQNQFKERTAHLQSDRSEVEILPQREPIRSRDEVGAMFGISGRYVQEAKAVKEAAPALFEKVKEGEAKLHDAYRQVRKEKEREERAAVVAENLPLKGLIEHRSGTEHVLRGSVDLLFTDPPYNISDDSKLTKVGDSVIVADFDGADDWDSIHDPAEYKALVYDWVEEWARVLRCGGSVVSFIDRILVGTLWEAFIQYELKPKAVITWVKLNSAPNGKMRRNFSSGTETMVWAVKLGEPYTFNDVPDWHMRNYIQTNIITDAEKAEGGRHPTQKPISVLTPIIQALSNPGDLVLDPFAGSGSTGVTAHRLKRHYHLIERDSYHVNIARQRLSKEEQGS
jgi:site-specific DNA-methyltransferase (adenine-specific)